MTSSPTLPMPSPAESNSSDTTIILSAVLGVLALIVLSAIGVGIPIMACIYWRFRHSRKVVRYVHIQCCCYPIARMMSLPIDGMTMLNMTFKFALLYCMYIHWDSTLTCAEYNLYNVIQYFMLGTFYVCWLLLACLAQLNVVSMYGMQYIACNPLVLKDSWIQNVMYMPYLLRCRMFDLTEFHAGEHDDEKVQRNHL